MCRNSPCKFPRNIDPFLKETSLVDRSKRLSNWFVKLIDCKTILLSTITKTLLSRLQTSTWCADYGTLTRNARTIDTSSFAWPQVLRDLWVTRAKLWEWSKNGAVSLVRFTSSTSKPPMRIVFGPEDGKRTAIDYQQQYGYRGEWLIEQLGNGLGPGLASLYSQPVPNTVLTPPLSSLR